MWKPKIPKILQCTFSETKTKTICVQGTLNDNLTMRITEVKLIFSRKKKMFTMITPYSVLIRLKDKNCQSIFLDANSLTLYVNQITTERALK